MLEGLGKCHIVKAFSFSRQYPDFLFPGKTQYVTPEDEATPVEADAILDTINPITWVRTARAIRAWKPDLLVMKYWMSWFAPSLGYVARHCGCRSVVVLDNVIPHEAHWFDKPLTRYFLEGCDGFVSMSESVEKDLMRLREDAPHILLPHPLYTHFGPRMGREEAAARYGAALGMARTLRAEQAAYKACYGPAYACLSGAAGAERAMRLIAAPAADAAEREAMERLRREPLPRGTGTGRVLRCYLTGLTPKGPVSFEPNAASVWALRDSFRVGAGLLRRLAERYRSAGHDLILAMDPMDPDGPAGLLVPELGTAFLRTDPLFTIGQSALLQLRLDAAAESVLPSADLERLQALNAIRAELVSEAVRWLSRAKLHHDALESLCRPLVDFDGVTRETERLVKTLLNEE